MSSQQPGIAGSSSQSSSKKATTNNRPSNSSNSAPINGIRTDVDPSKVYSVAAKDGKLGQPVDLAYTNLKAIGNGSFGVVFQAKIVATNELTAIKKVLQDKRFKNRELQIMRTVWHPNIVALRYYFYSNGDKRDEVFLNLVLEYVPETVYKATRHYAKLKQPMPPLLIKLYMYQLFRSLAYIHSLGICHRDIKPQNLLLDPNQGILKLCDFGSAKMLVPGEPNVSYICSRYYRAPELIFGATDYTPAIDVWSSGCVMAEMMLGSPLFPGESGVDQLVEIIKILGTPTREQIKAMNPNYTEFKFPAIKAHPWSKVFRSRATPESLEFIAKLLDYTPTARLTAIGTLVHPYFDELRQSSWKLPNGRDPPALFDFTAHELSIKPEYNQILVPSWYLEELKRQTGVDLTTFTPIKIEARLVNDA